MWLSGEEIGDRVRAIRKSLRYSQKAMAGALGRPGSQRTIGRIEAGTFWVEPKRPDPRLLEEIGALAGLGLDHFRVAADVTNPDLSEAIIILNWLDRTAEELRGRVKKLSEDDAGVSVPTAETLLRLQEGIQAHQLKEESTDERRRKRDR
jgi:transcriptional regulator with XRE-family HTH domain